MRKGCFRIILSPLAGKRMPVLLMIWASANTFSSSQTNLSIGLLYLQMEMLTIPVVEGNYLSCYGTLHFFSRLDHFCSVSTAGSFSAGFSLPFFMPEIPVRCWQVSFSHQLCWHESCSFPGLHSSVFATVFAPVGVCLCAEGLSLFLC